MIELLMIEVGSPLAIFLTGAGGVLTTLAAQKWFPDAIKAIIGEKSQKQSKCEKDIAEIVSVVSVLLKVVKPQVKDTGMQNAIDDVENRLSVMQNRYANIK